MDMQNNLNALSAIANYYKNERDNETERLKKEIQANSTLISKVFYPRFIAALKTLQTIVGIEKDRNEKYNYEMFRDIWKGSYTIASIRDYFSDKIIGDETFNQFVLSSSIKFGMCDIYMCPNVGLTIKEDYDSINRLKITHSCLESIINEFPKWEDKVNKYADLVINTDKDKIAPKTEQKEYKICYASTVTAFATTEKEAVNVASEYLKGNIPEPFIIIG